MAETKTDYSVEIEHVSFEDDPLKFCKQIYAESSQRVDQLRPTNVENQEFYEGIDKVLKERKDDPRVERSALFVHQLTPAIDTRIGDIMSKLGEYEKPLTGQPRDEKADKKVSDAVQSVVFRLNQQLRDSGYLSEVFYEHILAAEIYRTPSAVKVGWLRDSKRVPVSVIPTEDEIAAAVLSGATAPVPHVKWEEREIAEPFAEWLRPEEFLYQPNVSLFEKDSTWAGHRLWLNKWEILARAKTYGWDVKKAQRFFDEAEVGIDDDDTQTISDEIQADKDTPHDKDFKAEKFLLVEWYVIHYDESAKKRVSQLVVLENKAMLFNKKSPYIGFNFPFVLITANKSLGSMENISSIDKGKFMQRLYNDVINSFIDGITYRIFPPFKKSKGTKFGKEPVYGPGRIWELDNIDDLVPVIENPGQLPDLPALMETVAAKIRDLLNAPDFQQGFNAQQYEKATASKLRASGAARRSTPTTKKYGQAILEVAYKYLALNQQYAEDAVTWVVDAVLDVPSLTNISDPEDEKQEALLIHSSMREDPMFATPNGKRKIRNAWERVVRAFFRTEVDRYCPTEEELDSDLQIAAEMQKAALEKQSIQEQMAMEAADAPQTQGQMA